MEDPQILFRNMILTMMHPIAGPIKMSGSPIKLSETPPVVNRNAPELGEHTDHILRKLLDASIEDLAQWRADGAIQ